MLSVEYESALRKRSRGWAYTVFNYSSDDLAVLGTRVAEYHVFAEETCPTTGRNYIQGYIYFKDVKTGSAVIKCIAIGDIHVEPQGKYSSPKANRDYIVGPYKKGSKEKPVNESAVEIGEMPVQGSRRDLIAFKDAIKNGLNRRDAYDEYPNLMACYPKMYNELRAMYLEDVVWSQYESGFKPEINVIYGRAGCGKTRAIYEKHGRNVYKLEIGDGSSGSVFWNGYDGQDVIVIDDFYGQLKLDYMLRILDRYPQQFNTKGGYTWRTATKIYITSNESPDKWYSGVKNTEVKAALMRRFDNIIDLYSEEKLIVDCDVIVDNVTVSPVESVAPVNEKLQEKDAKQKLKCIISEKYCHIDRCPTKTESLIKTYDEMIDELRIACDYAD